MPNQLIVKGVITIRSLDPESLPGVDAGRVLKIRYVGRLLLVHKSMTSYVRFSGTHAMEESDASVDDQANTPNITI